MRTGHGNIHHHFPPHHWPQLSESHWRSRNRRWRPRGFYPRPSNGWVCALRGMGSKEVDWSDRIMISLIHHQISKDTHCFKNKFSLVLTDTYESDWLGFWAALGQAGVVSKNLPSFKGMVRLSGRSKNIVLTTTPLVSSNEKMLFFVG